MFEPETDSEEEEEQIILL